jgi:hypothetical protein
MPESISTLRKPGFPKLSATENAFRTVIEYIGLSTTLEAAEPATGSIWGDFAGTVISTDIQPTENASYSEMTVTVEQVAETNEFTYGEKESEVFEIDWTVIARSMFEHPQFAPGGANELVSDDVFDLEQWTAEKDKDLQTVYKYRRVYENGASQEINLSDSARLFARGIQLGQETFEDFAPVARKTSTYVGGPPDESEAGEKSEPTGFSNLPSGYEWRKNADRSITAGSRTRFDRTEEWLGAIKVLSDKNTIYWEAPPA